MWGHMYGDSYMMSGFVMLVRWSLFIWFVVFTVLIVWKLDKIIKLLEKK